LQKAPRFGAVSIATSGTQRPPSPPFWSESWLPDAQSPTCLSLFRCHWHCYNASCYAWLQRGGCCCCWPRHKGLGWTSLVSQASCSAAATMRCNRTSHTPDTHRPPFRAATAAASPCPCSVHCACFACWSALTSPPRDCEGCLTTPCLLHCPCCSSGFRCGWYRQQDKPHFPLPPPHETWIPDNCGVRC